MGRAWTAVHTDRPSYNLISNVQTGKTVLAGGGGGGGGDISYALTQMNTTATQGYTQADSLEAQATAAFSAVPTVPSQAQTPMPADYYQFEAAEARFKSLDEKFLIEKKRRELNALYMQAIKGDCVEDRPTGFFNGNARSEWAKWNALHGMSQEQAKCTFVEHLRKAG